MALEAYGVCAEHCDQSTRNREADAGEVRYDYQR
jgi:hypothetical protein